MEIVLEKNPSTKLHNLIPGDTFITGEAYYIVTNNGLFPAPCTKLYNLIPGDTFITGEAYYIVTNNGLFPAPLPDDIVCVNLDTGAIRMFKSTDIVFMAKVYAMVRR